MTTYPFYSVKVRHSTGKMPSTDTRKARHFEKARTSFFQYDRFYLFHNDDIGFVNRMFNVYMLHTITPEILGYLNDMLDIEMVTSLGHTKLTRKVSTKIERGQQQASVPWHVGRSKIENYMLVVPTYTFNLKFSTRQKHAELPDGRAIGYVRSKVTVGSVIFKDAPLLVINERVIPNPCMFCARYLDGFQAGICNFGTRVCHKTNTIFAPLERKTIQDDDVPTDGVIEV